MHTGTDSLALALAEWRTYCSCTRCAACSGLCATALDIGEDWTVPRQLLRAGCRRYFHRQLLVLSCVLKETISAAATTAAVPNVVVGGHALAAYLLATLSC